jgi:hypothetical protein
VQSTTMRRRSVVEQALLQQEEPMVDRWAVGGAVCICGVCGHLKYFSHILSHLYTCAPHTHIHIHMHNHPTSTVLCG